MGPRECMGVNTVHARRAQRIVIELGGHGVGGKNPGHFRIEIDEGNALDLGILQDLTNGEAIAAAKNQDAPRGRNGGESGMDERLMVTVFIARAELQMAVEKKAEVVLEARKDEMLITRVARKNNLVGVDVVFGGGGDLLGFGKSRT